MNILDITLKVKYGIFYPKPMKKQVFARELACAADDIKERNGLGNEARATLDLAAEAAVGLLERVWDDPVLFDEVGKYIHVRMLFSESWSEWKVAISPYLVKVTSGFDAAVKSELDAVLDKYGFPAEPDPRKFRVRYGDRTTVMTGDRLIQFKNELKGIGQNLPTMTDIEPVN